MRDLWIVQPYVPNYRVPFFDGLREVLRGEGIDLRIVAGRPEGAQALRGDAANPDWLLSADDRVLRLGSRSLTLSSTRRHWKGAAAVIVPHMGSSIDALSALALRREPQRVGVWGHIAPYTAAAHPVDAAVERWQLRRADHVFAYTAGGVDFAIRAGVPLNRTTCVQNAVDTAELEANLRSLSEQEVSDFQASVGAPARPSVLFLGGLDSSKRIDFLADVMNDLDARGSQVHFLIGGRGEQSTLLEPAVSRGQATMLGYVSAREKATALAASRAIVCPGRVGLLAVDALVAGRPILTTRWPFHAPEIEYLSEGESLFTSTDAPRDFADLVDRVTSGPRPACAPNWSAPRLQQMVFNFAGGIRQMMAKSR